MKYLTLYFLMILTLNFSFLTLMMLHRYYIGLQSKPQLNKSILREALPV